MSPEKLLVQAKDGMHLSYQACTKPACQGHTGHAFQAANQATTVGHGKKKSLHQLDGGLIGGRKAAATEGEEGQEDRTERPGPVDPGK